MELLIQLGVVVVLLALGFFAGRSAESRHFRDLEARQQALAGMLVTQTKTFAQHTPGDSPPCMLVGEAVIATDYLKSFLGGLRKIFGGEMKSYQSLLVRARREALLRVLEQAQASGYNALCNVRFDSADIGGNSTMRRVATVAVIASATAYHAAPQSA